jgi:hypothetical protein
VKCWEIQRARYIGMIGGNKCIHSSGMETSWKKVTLKIKRLMTGLFNGATQLFVLYSVECRMIYEN